MKTVMEQLSVLAKQTPYFGILTSLKDISGIMASFFIAETLWVWVALIAALLLVLAVEFLNAAIERLCDHLHPGKHEAIRITKDFASAGVLFALVLAGLVWGAAALRAFGVL